MSNTQTAVLFALEAFYRAFQMRDMEAMETVWADDESICCIHPGWHPLTGREEVMDTWSAILENPETPDVAFFNPAVQVYGDVAVTTCHELIDGQYLSVTNVLVLREGRWLMVHHQAGPVALPPEVVEDGFTGTGNDRMN